MDFRIVVPIIFFAKLNNYRYITKNTPYAIPTNELFCKDLNNHIFFNLEADLLKK